MLKDDKPIKTISLASQDTVLYIDSLLPNKTYNFTSLIHTPDGAINNSIPVTTLDTTSHNFTWQTWTFGGDAGSCTLYDVAIIDENDIWAVGDIDIADTSINGYTTYNAVHWDGNTWKLKRISTVYNGNLITPPLYGIYSFSSTDIWLSAGIPIHGDGENWVQYHLFDMGILGQDDGYLTKIWGGSSNDIYFIGTLGTIAHYQNGQWSKIESGTELNINDIWGYTDGSGNNLILCAASDLGTNHQKKLLRIIDNSVDTLKWQPQKTLFTVWPGSTHKIYAGGGKTYASSNNTWVEQTSVQFFSYKIRGNGLNDVYAVGGHFSHFNGYTWKEIPELFLSGGNYEGVATKGSTTCAVGYLGAKALVAIINK